MVLPKPARLIAAIIFIALVQQFTSLRQSLPGVRSPKHTEAAMEFQSGMILPTSLFEAFKHPFVGPLISPIARFFVGFPAAFLRGFPPSLTPRFLRNFTRNVICEVVVD